jgi:3' terminal RNA ribose 2'-O-methyltransferase Hen1
MLLTITTTHRPATDLGHLARKNPARVQTFELTFGKAHVFYPEATEERCTVALLLEIDPIGLVRGRRGPAGEGRSLEQYVNDRPYVASSFLSVAIADVFGSALSGKSKDRPELVEQPLPLIATLSVLPCRGGPDFLRRLFEPLGYEISATGRALDPRFPEWGESRYFHVTLTGTVTLRALLSHLYVLVPVLDNDKHYWVGDEEVGKLLRHGAGWLTAHPEREAITRRYLKHRLSLVGDALARLTEGEVDAEAAEKQQAEEAAVEERISLNDQRLAAVTAALEESGAQRVLDLGCGEGQLVRELMKRPRFEEIAAMDVSWRALEIARLRLKWERLAPTQQSRLRFLHGSLMYRDERLAGYDAAAIVEVIEHLDPPRLVAFQRVLFEFARPRTIVLTTPNAEYNVKWETLPAGKFRHKDHRFEWTRAEFQQWAGTMAEQFGYSVEFRPVGPVDEQAGAPTQMAVFQLVGGPVATKGDSAG